MQPCPALADAIPVPADCLVIHPIFPKNSGQAHGLLPTRIKGLTMPTKIQSKNREQPLLLAYPKASISNSATTKVWSEGLGKSLGATSIQARVETCAMAALAQI
jgi:hypothetical protein